MREFFKHLFRSFWDTQHRAVYADHQSLERTWEAWTRTALAAVGLVPPLDFSGKNAVCLIILSHLFIVMGLPKGLIISKVTKLGFSGQFAGGWLIFMGAPLAEHN